MATKIITKNSSTATSIPTAGDLVQGELAVNVTDKRLFTEDSGGAIVELGTNPSTLTSGAATFSGDVGIGTSSPAVALDVNGATNTQLRLTASDSLGASIINFGDQANAAQGRIIYSHITDSFSFKTNNVNDRLVIDASGNVGIGTSSPSRLAHLYGTSNPALRLDNGTNSVDIGIATSSGALLNGSTTNDLVIARNGAYNIKFGTNGNTRATIDASGNVGIGVNPSYQLDVYDTAAAFAAKIKNFNGSDAGGGLWIDTRWNTAGNRPLKITSNNEGTSLFEVTGKGNVGIGTSSPVTFGANTSFVTVNGASSGNGYACQVAGTNYGFMYASTNVLTIAAEGASTPIAFATNNATRMVLDTSGNLLVGTTTTDGGYDESDGGATTVFTGASIGGAANGTAFVSRRAAPLQLNRQANDGDIAVFRKDGTTVGSIQAVGGDLNIGTGDTALLFVDSIDAILPATTANPAAATRDNAIDLGRAATRFDDIYATNGTIQTSDRNEKQDIEELSAAETAVAVSCKGLLRKFRWIDSVEEKGDDARIHFGIIAQDLQTAFAAEGLDAGRYAMFISSTWWETQTEVDAVEAVEFVQAVEAVYNEDGELVSEAVEGVEAVEAKDAYTRTDTFQTLADAPEGATERTRLGVRYPELLAFIIAAI